MRQSTLGFTNISYSALVICIGTNYTMRVGHAQSRYLNRKKGDAEGGASDRWLASLNEFKLKYYSSRSSKLASLNEYMIYSTLELKYCLWFSFISLCIHMWRLFIDPTKTTSNFFFLLKLLIYEYINEISHYKIDILKKFPFIFLYILLFCVLVNFRLIILNVFLLVVL